MPDLDSNAQKVIERLLSAYGVKTQRALAEALNVPSNNVSAWSQRNSVPGSAIIKCVLDTGVDLQWLLNGKLANANFGRFVDVPSGEALLNEITSNGGKAVLNRIMEAYGFTLQKQLCEYLGISSGTVSTWIRRNYFPGDVVISCALDTGVSLEWLALGVPLAQQKKISASSNIKILRKIIKAGVLSDDGHLQIDLTLLPSNAISPIYVTNNLNAWFVDTGLSDISNGKWLLGIDKKYDIYDVSVLPGNTINVSTEIASFICGKSEVVVMGKVLTTLIKEG